MGDTVGCNMLVIGVEQNREPFCSVQHELGDHNSSFHGTVGVKNLI